MALKISNTLLSRSHELNFGSMSTGARIPADRAKEFYIRAWEQASMSQHVDVVPITPSGELYMPWLEINPNVMGLAQGLKNPADYARTFFNSGDEKLDTIDVDAFLFIPKRWEESNIQKGAGVDLVLGMLSAQFLANMEQACFYSNSLGVAIQESLVKENGDATKYVLNEAQSEFDGWLRKLDSGVVINAQNSSDTYATLAKMHEAWPTRYDHLSTDLRWFLPSRLQRNMYTNLARARETNLGDAALNTNIQLTPYGIPAHAVPLFEERPIVVEHITLTGTTPVALRYKPVKANEVIALPANLAGVATTPYTQGASSEYVVDETNGTVARTASSSAISSGATVKIQYRAGTQALLSPPKGLVIGITNEVSIDAWPYPPANGTFYIIRGKFGWGLKNPGANVKGVNLKNEVVTIP